MRNNYNSFSVVNIKKAIILTLFVFFPALVFGQIGTQSTSITSGVTFDWSDTQNDDDDPATIKSVTVNGTVYNSFVVPTGYELNKLGPDGDSNNKIRKNGNPVINSSNPRTTWNAKALEAFRDKNLNHYFTANDNGEDICGNFTVAENENAPAQRQSITYSPAIPSNADGLLGVTERGGNNCFFIEVYGYPKGSSGGTEVKLGDTFVRSSGNYTNCTFGVPVSGSDYWKSGRCNDNGQTIAIALFYLNDLAETGSLITRIEFVGATEDHGDGKFFLIQKYAVDQQLIECLDNTYNGDLTILNNAPSGSTYTIISPPNPAYGNFTNFNGATGTYTFIPNNGFQGDVNFTYELCLPFPNNTSCEEGSVTLSYVPLPAEPTYKITCNSNSTYTLEFTNTAVDYEYSIDNGATFNSSHIFSGLTDGTYKVKILSTATNCESAETANTTITLTKLELTGTETGVSCSQDTSGSIDITVTEGKAPYTYSWTGPNAFSETTEDISNLAIGTYNILVTDAYNCTISDSFTISAAIDNTLPTITCPTNVTVNVDLGLCTASGVNLGIPTTADNCLVDSVTNDAVEPFALGDTTVTWTVEDGSGNKATCTQIVTVEDNIAPVINNTAGDLDDTLECSNTADIANALTKFPTATDNCNTTLTVNLVSDVSTPDANCANAYVRVRTWNFSDGNGNTSTNFTQTITVQDNTAPVIDNTNTSNITINCGAIDAQQQLTNWLNTNAGATATENCSTVKWTNDYGGDTNKRCATDNGITVKFTAEDECGNTSFTTATYLINDVTAPTITTPASNLTVECDGLGNKTELNDWLTSHGGAVATEDCSTFDWTNNFTTLSNECGETGTATVTFRVTDGCGNFNETTATFTIEDTTAPTTPTIPADVTYECLNDVPTPSDLTTTDNCSGSITASGSDTINNTNSCNVIITRTWEFIDACNNVTSISQTITVKDTTAPTLSLPANTTAECSDNLTPINFGTATAIDNCDPNPIVSYNDVKTEGECSGTYTITRTWTAEDSCGNIATADQIISTSDTTAPTFDQTDLPVDLIVECNAVPAPKTLTASDNCGLAIVTVTDTQIEGNCPSNYTILRTYTATDDCGLTKTHVQTITVQDTIPPTFVEALPIANVIVECDAVPTAETLTAIDNCGSATVTVSDIKTNGNCPNSYVLARTWIATDACGLTTSHTQLITVQDTTAPKFVEFLPRDTTVECDAIPAPTSLTATDNCGNAKVTFNEVKTNGSCINNYVIARTWTATDECGLTATHTQLITVQDTTAPVPSTSFETTLNVSCADIPDIPNLTFTDNCSSNISINFSETNSFDENVFVDYEIVRTWVVKDECDNESTYTQTLYVRLDEIFTELVAPDVCFNEGIINLQSLISENLKTNGTWEIVEGESAATLNGNIFDPTVIKMSEDFLPGTGNLNYLFRYTTTDSGCISVTEVSMNIHADCIVLPCGQNDIVISSAITPNGDGYNDTFDIKGIDLCGFVADVKIYNRWGALVYESKNYTLGSIETSGVKGDWNGTSTSSSIGSKGTLPTGTYYYIINLKNSGLSPITGPVYIGTN